MKSALLMLYIMLAGGRVLWYNGGMVVVKRSVAARVIFSVGIVFMVGGVLALFAAIQGISRLSVIVPVLFLAAGAGFAIYAIRLRKRSLYLFFASYFLLIGFFLVLLALKVLPIPFSQSWPLLSVFAGLSLVPAGWYHFTRIHAVYLLPAVLFIVLGCVLLFFSLDLAPWSFKQFMLNWWPLLIVLAGFMLVLGSLVPKNSNGPATKR
ncbi:MAG: hypothetical protein LBG27_06255 [Spirochaetaceae bacterium]|nr:hypothetical protein [Spirochaetaceae bacterium]